MGKCKFQQSWLLKTDDLGYTISSWCRKVSDEEMFCIVCDVMSKVTKGYQSISQHVATTKHKKNIACKQGPLQLHLTSKPCLASEREPGCLPSQTVTQTATVDLPFSKTIRLYSARDSATRAELMWAMKSVICNMSAASCFGIAETFQAMFQTGFPEGFSLSPAAKLKYIITDALGPYFRKKVNEDAQMSCYTLLYDETTNNEGKKELQTAIRYWSTVEEVVTKHLETFFLGHATGEDLTKHLCLALDHANLSMSSLLMIGSDGPNVNKKVLRLMNEKVITFTKSGLLDIGFCNIHVVHNAFLKGLEKIGIEVSDIVIAIYYFFDGWPARWEDFREIQAEMKVSHVKFIKHVSSRWLTLEPAAIRLLEQWDAVKKYFLKYIPQKRGNLMSNASYCKIIPLLKQANFKAEILFVISSAHMFSRFTRWFQSPEPLIHLLYDELKSLVLTLISRVCKPEMNKKKNNLSATIFDTPNLLPIREIVVNDEINTILRLLAEKDKLEFLLRVQQHHIASCKHLLQKTPLNKTSILRYFRYLKPSERESKSSCQDIVNVARALPFSCDIELDVLQDEWHLLQLEDDIPNTDEKMRIDHYWRHYLNLKNSNNELKYPTIAKVVKSSLALSHGNADVERGFSKSARILTEDKASMSVRMLNARLYISDSIKRYNNKPELVPIGKDLLTLARGAYASYNAFLENERRELEKKSEAEQADLERIRVEEKRICDLDKENSIIQSLEDEFQKAKKQQSEKRITSDKLLEEANLKLKKALEKNDITQVRVAQAMLDSVQIVQKEEGQHQQVVNSIGTKIIKRKSKVITSFFNKKPKLV